ncbi:MAG: phenylalanine--tRNA ligase subunit alpha [Alphaproteobacteria bacterium]|nr:phenylalanine--tRNA ligase subunit alpha [Alphaproteobacteria bacterium]
MSTPDAGSILAAFRAELATVDSPEALEDLARRHTGKKSAVKALLKGLRDVDPAERPAVAAAINETAATIEAEVEAARERIDAIALEAAVAAEWMDLSMPGTLMERGARHPLVEVEDRCLAVLARLGFEVVDGPEVEHPFYNFDALNIPEHHPARDMQDTFWVDGGWCLRSHTTTVQARVLESRPELPIRVASRGRVYRNEAVDATHGAMFHQLEGFWLDRGLTFAHLKGVLAFVARSLYGDRRIRFKPKFYPYTEPSVGVDLACGNCDGSGLSATGSCEACHGAGWVTILGAGMVHPKVLRQFGYDPAEVTGIAFGLGTTRMAAQKTGATKVRNLYGQDMRTMRTLKRGAS